MNKKTYCLLLEGALLCFDNVTEQELINEYGFNPELARISFHLCRYLNSKEVLA